MLLQCSSLPITGSSFNFEEFCIHVTVHRNKFLYNKTNQVHQFPNLFRHEILHVSGSSSAHHQEFIHCTLGTGVCYKCLKTAFEQDQDRTALPSWSCLKAVWHIPLLSVQWINSWWWIEELPETCRISCLSKFGKLVHLVGFIIKKLGFDIARNFKFCYQL